MNHKIKTLIILIPLLLVSCQKIGAPSDLLGKWSPVSTECKIPDSEATVTLKSQTAEWTFAQETDESGVSIFKATLFLPSEDGSLEKASGVYSLKSESEIEKLRITVQDPALANGLDIIAHELSKSSLSVTTYIDTKQSTLCNIKFSK